MHPLCFIPTLKALNRRSNPSPKGAPYPAKGIALGYVGILVCGDFGTWVYGDLGTWVYGYWVYGYWVHGYMNIGYMNIGIYAITADSNSKPNPIPIGLIGKDLPHLQYF
jgi:hypothetical protein